MNVAIAQFYEVYKYLQDALKLEIKKDIFSEGLIKIMKLMIPFTPHLAFECLSLLNCKDTNNWPKINDKIFEKAKVNLVIQVNGKTRDVMAVKKDINEKEIYDLILKKSKAKKYIMDKKIARTIFIKNKIINYIVLN